MRVLKRLLYILWCPVTIALGQAETSRMATIYFDQRQDTASLYMNGLLDGNNTFTYPNFRAFQHMKKLTISNVGSGVVQHPRVTINFKKNWFDINSLRAECFEGASTPKEKALAVWKFMRDNRLHYFEPDWGQEIDDPIKLLGVYGYGMCYNTSFVTASIASGFPWTGLPYLEYSPRNRHSVKDIRFDSVLALLDSDIEVFYLNNDNERLASYDEIARDKHLIKRVHHYGKGYNYNSLNNFVAYAVYEPTPPVNYAGLYNNYHTLDFQLRPGESIVYNWEPGKYYHHNVTWESPNVPPGDFGNGKFVYNTDFTNADINELINGFSGVKTFSVDSIKPNIHPAAVDDSSSFIIRITSPFAIVNGIVKGNFYRESFDDRLKVFFSKDSMAWQSVWESSHVGSHSDSMNLYEKIRPIGARAVYHYYLKFEMLSTSGLSCGVDSLQIITDFQVSRFFLPSLQLGKNFISYSDNSLSRNVAVKIEWNETSENMPPPRIEKPVFPADHSVVDSLKFTFQWETVFDADGIIDYEFMLSDREDMRFPLSPSFEVYTSKIIDGSSLTSFTIPFDGMINANTIYYWKVRAKDSKGAWGEWSPVWSFTPQGPMPPMMNQSKVKEDSIILSWQKNEKGSIPLYYEIHASNEAFGFTPDESTLLDTTQSTTKAILFGSTSYYEGYASSETLDSQPDEFALGHTIPLNTNAIENFTPKTFYRIIAVDDRGSKSGPSNYNMVPYPYVYDPPDSITIRPKHADTLRYTLKTNNVYITDMLFPTGDIVIHDSIHINVLSKPDWITYNENDRMLLGTPNYVEAHSDSVIVEFTGVYTGYKNIQVFKPPVMANSKPLLGEMDSVACIWSIFTQTIKVSDPDSKFGDYVSKVDVLAKPSWLEVEFNEADRSLQVWGIPKLENAMDTVLIIKAFDAIGESVLKTFDIKVKVPEQLNSDQSGIITVAPNPFETKISFIYQLIQPSSVKIMIFNSGAQKIYDTSLEEKPAGIYEIEWDSASHNSGLYNIIMEIVETEDNTNISSRKIIKL